MRFKLTTLGTVVLAIGVVAFLRHLRTLRRRRRDLQWGEEFVESIVGDARNQVMPTGWRDAVRAWLETSFPRGSTIDAVDELKADLAYWDFMVADVALPLNEGSPVSRGAVNIEAGLRAYGTEVQELLPGHSGEEAAKLREYLHYCELLQNVYALAAQRLLPQEDAGAG